MSIDLVIENATLSILNVYLPYDDGNNLDEYTMYLGKITSFLEANPYSCVCGDFNADTLNMSRFGAELVKWINREKICFTSNEYLKSEDFAYLSDAHGSTHRLDHIISNHSFHMLVSDVAVNYNFITSDHFPLFTQCDIGNFNLVSSNNKASMSHNRRVRWDTLTPAMCEEYTARSETELKEITLDPDLILCNNTSCTKHEHITSIDAMYNATIEALQNASNFITKLTHEKQQYQIPGWNEVCADAHNKARNAFLIWRENGSPKQGALWEMMRTTRAQFKYALRHSRIHENTIKANQIADSLLKKDTNQFWKHIKNVEKNELSAPLPETVGGSSGMQNVADMWKQYYERLLNSSPSPSCVPTKSINYTPIERIQIDEVEAAIKRLNR